MADLLLIDDDAAVIPAQVRQIFPAPAHRVRWASTGRDGLASVRREAPDVILLDLMLPDQSGLEVYRQIRAIDARIPVIFITMAKTADTAIEAMKHGAFNYLHKPLALAQLSQTVREACEVAQRMRSPVLLNEDPPDERAEGSLFGSCPAMLEVYKSIGRVAAQDVTVLITGESGTGKELVARALYQHSARSKAPFLALNCAAIPEQLLESELFGHEKGAFTGADRRRIGKFEQCNGGTLLLDEIGDMPLALQAKILRVLQERTFERVGGNETVRTDVRVIASTHRDLAKLSAQEKFRADLFYRLGVFSIHLPPLRERGDDVAALARHYVRRFSAELGRDIREIAPETLELLAARPWQGNVRELQSVLKQALLKASGTVLLPLFLPSPRSPASAPGPGVAPTAIEALIQQRLSQKTTHLYAEAHDELDRFLLPAVLEFCQGNQSQAARMLGVSRQTLRMKLRALAPDGSEPTDPDDSDPDLASN